MKESTTSSIVNLITDKVRILNIVHNNVIGRIIISGEGFFKVSYYNWNTPVGITPIELAGKPSVIYLIKHKYLTEEQILSLSQFSS